MIRKIIIEGIEMIQVSDLYECMIERFSSGKLSGKEEINILRNLQEVEWIHKLFDESDLTIQTLYELTLEKMKIDLIPCPLTWSALYYNFSKVGVKTNEMRLLINTNESIREILIHGILRCVFL